MVGGDTVRTALLPRKQTNGPLVETPYSLFMGVLLSFPPPFSRKPSRPEKKPASDAWVSYVDVGKDGGAFECESTEGRSLPFIFLQMSLWSAVVTGDDVGALALISLFSKMVR